MDLGGTGDRGFPKDKDPILQRSLFAISEGRETVRPTEGRIITGPGSRFILI